MKFNILTIFPELITPYLQKSIIKRAIASGVIEVNVVNIRDFAPDKHHTVDDTPYGGGAGMVMKVEPIHRALEALKSDRSRLQSADYKRRTVVMAARGEQFTQAKAAAYGELNEINLICGRYEGIDQRVVDHLADEELSIGPFVLAGGELPALCVMEAAARHVPGVLGNPNSLTEESFSSPATCNLQPTTSKEYPQYTKPEEYNGWKVPKVLLSGNHEEIKKWRSQH